MAVMYDLTPMTGREAQSQRTVVIQTFEVNYRAVMVVAVSFIPAVTMAVLFYPVLGQGSLAVFFLVIALALVLFQVRSSRGLRLYTWRRMWDAQRASYDKVWLCGRELDLSMDSLRILAPSSVPNPHRVTVSDLDDPMGFEVGAVETEQSSSDLVAPTVEPLQGSPAAVAWMYDADDPAASRPPAALPVSNRAADPAFQTTAPRAPGNGQPPTEADDEYEVFS